MGPAHPVFALSLTFQKPPSADLDVALYGGRQLIRHTAHSYRQKRKAFSDRALVSLNGAPHTTTAAVTSPASQPPIGPIEIN